MKNQQGNPEFCPGCPNAGSFCGEVTDESLTVNLDMVGRMVGRRVEPQPRLLVQFTDTDGMTSKAMSIESHHGNDSSFTEPDVIDVHEHFDSKEGRAVILDRICRCSGVTSNVTLASRTGSYSYSACRALSSGTLIALSRAAKEIPESS